MSDSVKTLFGRGESFSRTERTNGFDEAADHVNGSIGPTMAAFKDQASQVAEEAKTTVSALADEARAKLADIVDQQKSVGADQVAGVARAVQAAAGDLQQTSPQLARLIQQAAEKVDSVAETIRASDIGDVISTLSSFGRRRPVALFGGAVVAGFLLARFIKSEAPEKGALSSPHSL